MHQEILSQYLSSGEALVPLCQSTEYTCTGGEVSVCKGMKTEFCHSYDQDIDNEGLAS